MLELGVKLEAGVLGAPVVQHAFGVARVAPGVRVVHRWYRFERARRAEHQRVGAWVSRGGVLGDGQR
jgi:hypothetical protein